MLIILKAKKLSRGRYNHGRKEGGKGKRRERGAVLLEEGAGVDECGYSVEARNFS
jgi:hypothetical protein